MDFKEEFKKIINSNNKLEIVSILDDKEKCIEIINNNLFWENIDFISLHFDESTIIKYINVLSNYSYNFFTYDIVKLFKHSFHYRFYINLFDILEKSNLDLEVIFKYIISNNLLSVPDYALFISMYNKKYKDLLYNNLETILRESNYMLEIKQIVSSNSKFLPKINKLIEENPDNIVYDILINSTNKTENEIDDEKIFNFLKKIIDEILTQEKVKYSDIELIGAGSTSRVYSIGEKVLKIGSERDSFVMNNNKRFLKPILRTNINSALNDEVLFCIEITEKVDTDNIKLEDAYEIYKELREQGLIWVDCEPKNLGRLKRKNSIYMDEPINPVKESINYNTDLTEELEKGELVILDNDFIFPEDWFIQYIGFDSFQDTDMVTKFENKYQTEKKQKNY